MSLIVFAYDFPHKKTYEGLLWLHVHRVKIAAVIGAPRVQLNVPSSSIRVAPAGLTYPDTREVCARIGVPYYVAPHNSPECIRLLEKHRPRLGAILGARVLSQEVIEQFVVGVINMHPGLIPENRGLDNLKWAILDGINQGVTTHLIAAGKDVDLGRLIERRVVPVLPDDTLVDVHLRIQNVELQMLVDAIARAENEVFPPFSERGVYRSAVPPEEEQHLLRKFAAYRDGQNA